MRFGCSKVPSHRDGSFEYPQHMFWSRNKKNNFLLRIFIWGPAFKVLTVAVLQPQSVLAVHMGTHILVGVVVEGIAVNSRLPVDIRPVGIHPEDNLHRRMGGDSSVAEVG